MRPFAFRLGVACVALGFLAGCSEGFDPRAPSDRAFAVFGTLDGRLPLQRLRVQDLDVPLNRTPDALPASVTSTELTSGVTTVWADSLVRLADGTDDHLFTAPLALRPGETHRLRFERLADGAASTVEVRLPSPALTLGAADGLLQIRVTLSGLSQPPTALRVRYRARRGTADAEVITTHSLGLGTSDASFLLGLRSDAGRIQSALGGADGVELLSAVVEFEARSASPVLVQGGVGDVEWVLAVTLPLDLLQADVEAAGLVDRRDS